jgi:hypothetical protein
MNEVRDMGRESLFNDAYGYKPVIYMYYELNPDKTFKIFRLRFVYKDNQYTLTEYYKDRTNTTDYCDLNGERFNRFVDAEIKVAEKIKNGDNQ